MLMFTIIYDFYSKSHCLYLWWCEEARPVGWWSLAKALRIDFSWLSWCLKRFKTPSPTLRLFTSVQKSSRTISFIVSDRPHTNVVIHANKASFDAQSFLYSPFASQTTQIIILLSVPFVRILSATTSASTTMSITNKYRRFRPTFETNAYRNPQLGFFWHITPIEMKDENSSINLKTIPRNKVLYFCFIFWRAFKLIHSSILHWVMCLGMVVVMVMVLSGSVVHEVNSMAAATFVTAINSSAVQNHFGWYSGKTNRAKNRSSPILWWNSNYKKKLEWNAAHLNRYKNHYVCIC